MRQSSHKEKLKIGLGLLDGAWKQGETNGVCFSVHADYERESKGIRSRSLLPKKREEDRGLQHAVITLPEEAP